MSWFIILGWFPLSKDILNHSLLNRFNQLKLDIYFCKPRWICKNNLGLNRSSIFNRTDLIHDCHSPTQPQLNLIRVGSDKGIGRNQPPTNLILRCKLYSIPGFMWWYNWYMFNCCFCFSIQMVEFFLSFHDLAGCNTTISWYAVLCFTSIPSGWVNNGFWLWAASGLLYSLTADNVNITIYFCHR